MLLSSGSKPQVVGKYSKPGRTYDMSQHRSKLVHTMLALVSLVISAVLWPSLGASVTYAACVPSNSVCISNDPTVTATLNGHDQTLSYTLAFTLDNNTTTGWNVTISSTQFTNSGSPTRTLPADASSVTDVPTAVCLGTCTADPTNPGTIHYPVPIPAGASPTPNKFYNAQADTGEGTFNVTVPVSVVIPGNAYADTYTSTITITLVTGGP